MTLPLKVVPIFKLGWIIDVKTTQIYLEFPEGFLKDVFSDWIPDVNTSENLRALCEPVPYQL